MADSKRPVPPTAPKRPHEVRAQGEVWQDDYAWLRADNWREVLRDPAALPAEIRAHLEAENAYCEAWLAPLDPLKETLKREMRARLKEDDSEPPAPDGPWLYYSRFRAGGQHRLYCRRPREGGEETILLDGDARAQGHGFFRIGAARHAPTHDRFAWSHDPKGSEMYEIRVREGERDLDDRIPGTTGDFVWTPDGAALLYTLQDEDHRPYRIQLHRLGEPPENDRLIFEEADPAWFLSLRGTRLGRRAFIDIHGHDAQEFHVLDLADPLKPARLMAPRRPGHRYEPFDQGERLFIKSNEGAQDFAIFAAPPDA